MEIRDAETLRARQAPLKDAYRKDPRAAFLTLSGQAALGTGVSARVDTFAGPVAAGLHPAAGGDGSEACSAEMLLQALAGCAGVTLKAVATAIGVEIRSGTVRADGDLDFRGTLGVSREVPAGFSSIRLRIELETDAPQEKLDSLLRLTERYCVVFQSLSASPAFTSAIVRAG
jgi:uncharacterized OsmC-like protein